MIAVSELVELVRLRCLSISPNRKASESHHGQTFGAPPHSGDDQGLRAYLTLRDITLTLRRAA